jgi:sugar phosphate permease
MLALAGTAQASVSIFLIAPALLIPVLHGRDHLSLARAGLLAAMPNLGMVLALFAWGALADHVGERIVLVAGLTLTAAVAAAAAAVDGLVALGALLFVGGLSSASANAASGRVVVGWFAPDRRGLAMGIRQIAQPVGVTVAAATVPVVADRYGIHWALVVPLVATALGALACALALIEPVREAHHRAARTRNPYRAGSFLWRIHAVSALLVVPQFTLSVFGLVWLVASQRWSVGAAGALVGASQLVGSAGRIGIGVLSDRLGSRVRLLRAVAVASAGSMALLALCGERHWSAAALVFVIATTISVADNGLAFTAVAEFAGTGWAGRALGAQNTGQFVAAAAVGPTMGALIAGVGYPGTFVVAAATAVLAVPFVPTRDARPAGSPDGS